MKYLYIFNRLRVKAHGNSNYWKYWKVPPRYLDCDACAIAHLLSSISSLSKRATACVLHAGSGSFPKQCCEGNSNLTGCVDSDMRTLSTNLSISGACQ